MLVIHDRSNPYKVLPITREENQPPKKTEDPEANLEHVTRRTKLKKDKDPVEDKNLLKVPVSILKRKAPRGVAAMDSSVKSKSPILRRTTIKPRRSNPTPPIIPTQRRRLLATTSLDESDRSYVPPAGTKLPDPNDSGIAKRLTRRRSKVEIPKLTNQSTTSSSTDEPFSDSENNEESDPTVLRKSHSVLPDLAPTLSPKIIPFRYSLRAMKYFGF